MHGVANGAALRGKRDKTSRSSDALDSFHRVCGFESEQRRKELLFIWWNKLLVFLGWTLSTCALSPLAFFF